eukprot:TRINITY_DN23797_c0_g1_i3.p1 TRINITY_DN23797_c0_g1~~TRINITY_DN23797_c0_g1_i3.p1  ORF type:complete len:258 (+),score=41.80 TRINITY_DN23797_c0_g1_i3:90-863(+)
MPPISLAVMQPVTALLPLQQRSIDLASSVATPSSSSCGVHGRTAVGVSPSQALAAGLFSSLFGASVLRTRHRRGRRSVAQRWAGRAEAVLIDGRAIAADVRKEVAAGVEQLVSTSGVRPCLAVVLVGDRADSATYVRMKTKAADEVGVTVLDYKFGVDVTMEELVRCVSELNDRKDVHGILVQLPLPPHLQEDAVLAAIDVRKDVDGFSPENLGLLAQGRADEASALPCTPAGCMELLRRSQIHKSGKVGPCVAKVS